MVSINIFDVDSRNNNEPLLTLQSGEHILGRGSFSNCTDKRISRNHIVIKVEHGRATLKSVHINPCYFMSFNESNVQLLTKNLPVELSDGDKFAFLTDNWYIIKINRNDSFVNSPSSRTLAIPLLSKDSTDTLITSSSDTRISSATSGTTSFVKRSLDEVDSNEGRKKLKTINESLDQMLQDINEIRTPDKPNTAIKKQDRSGDDSVETTEEVFRKKEISDSDVDSDPDSTHEVTKDIQTVTPIQSSKSEVKEEVSSDSEDDENMPTDEPDSSNIQENVNEDLPVTSCKLEKINDETTKSDAMVEQSVSKSDDMGPEDNETARKEERGDAVDSSSSVSGNSIGNKLRREQCWYGSRCYRKNSRHREELSHPGDEDYNHDPNDDRPECSFGARCYRNNQMHRRQYKHPSSRPAPKPTGRRKRVRAAAHLPYDVQESGDEDGEPFSADESSSENYDDDDNSDSDLSGSVYFDGEENREELKIMYNEAKKFLRRKRKD